MTPEPVEIIHGDCIRVLRSLTMIQMYPFDLAFADPPANNGMEYGEGYNDRQPDGAYRAWCKRWFGLARQKSKRMILLPTSINSEMWDGIRKPKNTGVMHLLSGANVSLGFQPIYAYGMNGVKLDGLHASIVPGSDDEKRGVMPVEWCETVLKRIQPSSVLDLFAGHGSMLVACKRLGIRAVGIERSKDACEVVRTRLESERLCPECGSVLIPIRRDTFENNAERHVTTKFKCEKDGREVEFMSHRERPLPKP